MRIGLIVGTGLDFLSPSERWSEISTPYGPAFLSSITLETKELLLLRRHGPGLNIPPHLINYRANMWALRGAGVGRIIATAAVGSMRTDMAPGTLAVVGDFIDFTKRRVTTIYESAGDVVAHTDFSTPYCLEISAAMEKAAEELGLALGRRVTYLCVDGTRYETPAEVRMFAGWGGDVVGMTGVPEVILAREMGICYGALAILTNYAAGILDRPLSHMDVVECVSEKSQQIRDLLAGTVAKLPDTRRCCGA